MKKLSFAIGCTSLFLLSLSIPTVYASEQFSVEIKASKSTVEPKRLFIYTITVRNTGSSDAQEPILTLSLDEDTDFESASNSGRKRGDSVKWEDFTLAAGDSKTFNASVRVDDSASDGDDLLATAFIGNAFDESSVKVENKDDENNDDERAVTVELFSNKAQVEPTEPFSFIVRVKNNGRRKVTNTEVTVELADGIEFLSAANRGRSSGKKIVWKNIDLDANESRSLTASVRVSNDIAHLDSLTSIAYSEGSVHEHKIQVWDPRDGNELMEVHAFTNDDDVEAGGNIEYTVRVKNLADHEERIDVRAHIDPNTVFASASDGGIQYDRTAIQWDDITFKQSETQSFTISVNVKEDAPARQQLRFFAEAGRGRKNVVTSVKPTVSTGSVMIGMIASTEPVAVVSPLSLYQAADKTEAQPGSLMTYTVSLRNTGQETMKNLEVLEQFPHGQLVVERTDGGNAVQDGIVWTIAELLPGQKWTKNYSAKVAATVAHGTVIQRSLSVSSNGTLVASSQKGTGVISQLPQAGFGTFNIAFADSQKFLRIPKAHAKPAIKPTTQKLQKTEESSYILLWILVVLSGTIVGVIGGKKILQ